MQVSTQMFMRLARYDFEKLIGIFNDECKKAKVNDGDAKLIFDTQADYIQFATGHQAGVKLSGDAVIGLHNSVFDLKSLPVDLRDKYVLMQKALLKYQRGDEVLEAASSAILSLYMRGGVFTKK